MNDILKYWPINCVYDGCVMTIPLGEIINVQSDTEGVAANAIIEVRGGDSWSTDSSYDSIMEQWTSALAKAVVR